MKCICVTGASQPDLELVSDILRQAGMSLSKPTPRDESIDIGSWHEQVLTMGSDELEAGHAIVNTGRFMEQLASDIFVANIKASPWGWADTRSTWLLDFWLNFDPRLYFILVCVTPQQMLASAISTQTEVASVSAVMDAWLSHHQQILRFHLRNPQRSLLVNVRECAEHPQLLIKRCAEQWKLKIAAPAIAEPIHIGQDSVALYLAEQLSQDYPQTVSLQQELAATITRLDETEQTVNIMPLSAEHVIADYRLLKDRTAALTAARDEQSRLAVERQAKIDQLIKERDNTDASHAQQQKEAESRLNDAVQENELLLLQLHQVQEELESFFLKQESLQKQSDSQQSQITALTAARDEQSKLAVERQVQIDQLIKERDNTVASHAQQKEAESRLNDAVQENELLLLQLHQVQEELEHYFLQHQDKQKELQQAEARWQRMLQRNPDYCDYESIEVLPVENQEGNPLIWRLKNFNIAGRTLVEIEFKTIVEQGIAGFIFPHQACKTGIFTRWVADPANQNELTIIPPIGKDDLGQQRLEILLDLASSDWVLLHALARFLQGILEQPPAHIASAGFIAEPVRNGLIKLREILEKFPSIFRYDLVALKREQVNPDYEHLWLRFENLAFGNKHWSEFEFRLSCANVRPNDFGAYPKLEFPEKTGRAPFEEWFIESYDDFGAKFELRFALPDSLDMAVLQRISESDRGFLLTLIVRLPAVLATLQNAGVQLKRPWEDWIQLAKDIQRIYVLQVTPHLAATETQVSTESKVSGLANTAIARPAKPHTATTTKARKIK